VLLQLKHQDASLDELLFDSIDFFYAATQLAGATPGKLFV